MRWGLFEGAADRLQHAVEVFENLVIPEPDDAVAMSRELDVAPIVGISLGVLTAVELDH